MSVGASPARADELSEADVRRLVHERDPDVLTAREAIALAEAELVAAGLYANPTIGWDREHLPGDESEDALVVTVPVDLSSRRATRKRLARAGVSEAGASAARVRSDAVVRALTLFYRLIAEQRRADIEQRAADRLAEAARVVGRRRDEGAASGYDQARIELERELALSALRQTRARADRLRIELVATLGVDGATFAGTLEPNPSVIAQPDAPERQSLRLLRAAEEHARAAGGAARRAWIPTLSISGGPRVGVADETRLGYVVGVSLELPVFSRGQAVRARADARRRHIRAEADAAQRAGQIQRVRAEQILTAARAEARRFDDATRDRVARLERAADSGYREGARSIVELLDAQRARTSVEIHRLQLALTAKRAEVELRAARGEFE